MLSFLGALTLVFVLTGTMVPVLRRAQFMDVPNHRSSHVQPVLRGGGVAVLVGLVAVAALSAELDAALVALLIATIVLAGVGLVDDLRSLSSSVRFLVQVAAAIALVTLLLRLGGASWWWLPVLVVGVVGYVNAFNFMDGVDGISGMTAAVVGLWWAWAGHAEGHATLATLGLVLAGSALGFLPWNAPKAKIFLGDVGSYGVGMFIAGLSVVAVVDGLPWLWALAPLAVYCADTGWVLVKRARAGKNLTEAHREHVYQCLVDSGWSHLASASLCAGATALVCLVAGVAGPSLAWAALGGGAVIVVGYLNVGRFHRRVVGSTS